MLPFRKSPIAVGALRKKSTVKKNRVHIALLPMVKACQMTSHFDAKDLLNGAF